VRGPVSGRPGARHEDGRPSVLTFALGYLPGYDYGGPVRTLANMVSELGDELSFHIVTRDRGVLDQEPYGGIKPGAWHAVGKAQVYYASPARMTLRTVRTLLRDVPHDVLYLNSFFDPRFALLPLLARRFEGVPRRPVIIAPRGQFTQGALALKRWKKRPFLTLATVSRIYDDLTWHASTSQEAVDIRRVLGRVAERVMIAPNVAILPERAPAPVSASDSPLANSCGALRVVFFSRISRMKNLEYALYVLARVSVPVHLSICGAVTDPAYWTQCETLIRALPAHVTAEYCGEIAPDAVPGMLARHDLLLLPTRGENFGHVIFESLAAGTPVIISDRTPWPPDELGACTVIPLDQPDAYIRAVEVAHSQLPAHRFAARLAAVDIARRSVACNHARELNRALFHSVLDRDDA
jgi:glycosyltransferase involved in cell wall biosynthesis